jgi:site-specific recombinase XerD
MAWTRQLPATHHKSCKDRQACPGCKPGLWASTVYTPTGRLTESHPLKSVIERWAADREAEVRAGDWIDPRAGKVTVGQWWERCRDARHLELASRQRDASQWRCHVEPKWGRTPIGAILKPDVSAWVVEMRRAHRDDCRNRVRCQGCKVGAATIIGALGVLRALLDQAVDARMIRVNPARGVSTPPPDAHVDRVLTPDEEDLLLANLDERFPDRPDARLFVEVLLDCGLRWEEAAALPRDLVDLRRGRIQVAYVMERSGGIRGYAKSEAGNRPVPIGDSLLPRLRDHVLTVPAGADPRADPACLVFKAPGPAHRDRDKCKGKRCPGCAVSPLRYPTWLRRVWLPGLLVDEPIDPPPRPRGKPGPAPRAVRRVPLLDEPQPTPHDCRHTYATHLADEGVPQHDLMALLGHKDYRSIQRYMHSGEDRFERARQARQRARAARPERAGGQVAPFTAGPRS